jgi:uncharacterized lipoprotein YmbA
MYKKSRLSATLVFAIALLSGCASTPNTNFYSLSSELKTDQRQPAANKEIALRIGPFGFPSYLQRPNIVTRTVGNRLEVSEFQRWAGSLEDDFHRVLGLNLGVLLNSSRISVYPAEMRFTPDYYLTGDVITFDGELGGRLTLEVSWTINRENDQDALVVKRSVFREPVNGNDYTALIAAYDRVLADYSREVQATLAGIMRRQQ